MSNPIVIVQIDELIKLQNDKSKQLKSSEYKENGILPIVDQGSSVVCGYTNDLTKKYDKGLPVIIFGDHTLHTKFINFDFAIGADGTQVIVPKNKNCDTKYLYFLVLRAANLIGSEGYKRHLSILRECDIEFISDFNEQQKIASILTAVDDVIESTQAQINKLKDLKTGMMQELLTKGIGHTEFKDSPVGRIPKAWDCSLLDKVARRGSGHTPDKQTHEYWNGGIKWISLADSSKLDRLYISETTNEISELGIKNSSAVLHPKGTVVLSRDAGIGKSAITTDQMAVSQHFMAWICGEKLNNYFLYYLLQLWKPRFENIAIGSTIKTIGLQYFKSLEIPVPGIVEQEKIANALLSTEKSIFRLEAKKDNLSNTKKALMQDLLTGKVRVKITPQ